MLLCCNVVTVVMLHQWLLRNVVEASSFATFLLFLVLLLLLLLYLFILSLVLLLLLFPL